MDMDWGLLSSGVEGLVPLQEGVIGAFSLLIVAVVVLVFVITLVGTWKMYTKAGQPGWASIIPIYNVYVLVTEIAGRDLLWAVLSILVPFAIIVLLIDVAKRFGKGTGYAIGLIVLPCIFMPLLGFGDARYQGAPN